MSSIISDIFYGSKQNLLDNYLVHRNQINKQSSILQEQKTVFYTSSIHLQIRIPSINAEMPIAYQITAEMGAKIDQTIVQFETDKVDTVVASLILNDLDKKDLNKYTNIKITISEGKYRNKMFGFIPIETIKSLSNYPNSEKTIILQMKGKKSIGFSTIQCVVKAQFPNNNILNSQIMKTQNKDYSSFYDNRSKQKCEDQSDYIQNEQEIRYEFANNQTKGTRLNIKNYQNRERKNHNKRRSSQNMFVDQKKSTKTDKIGLKKQDTVSQFVRQIKSISVIFSQINIERKVQSELVLLRYKQRSIKLDEVCQFKDINSQGLQLQIQINNQVIGKIHASILLLILPYINGQLPIYNQNQKCIGTIHISSPMNKQNKQLLQKEQKEINIIHPKEEPVKSDKKMKELLCFSIQKCVMVNFCSELMNNESFDGQDQMKYDLFDFSKMQANNRIELVVRVNGLAYKFNQLVLKYLIDNDKIRIIQIKRKEGFFIHYFEELTKDQSEIQIQLYSNYRLISYSKHTISKSVYFDNVFIGGSTEFAYCQCGIFIRLLKLQVCQDYFRQTKIKYMQQILQSLIKGYIKISNPSDESIKIIMNNHKKATYIQTKKLMNLLQPHFDTFYQFQNSQLKHIFSQDELHKTDDIIKLNISLLRQFIFIDPNGSSVISRAQFQKLITFYQNQNILGNEQFTLLLQNLIFTHNGSILYPFFIAGFYFLIENQTKTQINLNAVTQIDSHQLSKEDINNLILTPPMFKQIAKESQPFYYIQKIILNNIHLLNARKIPNISLNISKKIHYSNANPEFIIQKEINLMENIKIYHRNIATNELSLLVQFQPIRRHSFYELQPSGKASARIIWGH